MKADKQPQHRVELGRFPIRLHSFLTLGVLGVLAALSACSDSDGQKVYEAMDRLGNGPIERERQAKVAAAMPPNQSKVLAAFKATCAEYSNQANDMKKSEVFRKASAIYRDVGPIKDWSGILRGISTDQGGSTATLRIHMGSSTVWDKEVRIGSPAYKAAAELSENQPVVFSGRSLRDYNVSEKGKVCDPDFLVTLTAIRKLE
jgi:hypothetical protein